MTANRIKRPAGVRRLGLGGYAAVLRAIQRTPMTTLQLCTAFGLTVRFGRRIVGRMEDLGLIHAQAFIRQGPTGPAVPVWAYGADAEGEPRPKGAPARVLTRATTMPLLIAFAQCVYMLREPATMAEISERTGVCRTTVSRLVRHCRAIGLARIGDWQRQERGGTPSPMYVLGNAANCPKPQPLSWAETSARYRERAPQREGFAQMKQLIALTAGALPTTRTSA